MPSDSSSRFASSIRRFCTCAISGEPVASIYPWYHSNGSWNTTLWNYKNPKMDQILDAARAAKSDEERAKHYMEFQALAVSEPAGVIPYVLNHTNAYGSKVKGFKSHPMMWLDLRQTSVQ